MNTNELENYLKAIRVPEEDYVIGGLGYGEVHGVGIVNGVWSTYYSERGQHRNIEPYVDEHHACMAFAKQMRDRVATVTGVLHDLPEN